MDGFKQLIKKAGNAVKNSKHLVAFTGAGISVESGIPAFRGKNGLWSRYDPKYVELDYFKNNPEECWPELFEIFYSRMLKAGPNKAHEVLARWENQGLLKAVITQNIDSLHQEAGNQKVIEYHGNSRTLECLKCQSVKKATPAILGEIPPRCHCGGVLKPSFVFFGEEIPHQASMAAVQEASLCDVMLVIGTTGAVMPANMIPVYAYREGAFIIEINPEPGEFTYNIVDLFLPLKAGEALSFIENYINQSAG